MRLNFILKKVFNSLLSNAIIFDDIYDIFKIIQIANSRIFLNDINYVLFKQKSTKEINESNENLDKYLFLFHIRRNYLF